MFRAFWTAVLYVGVVAGVGITVRLARRLLRSLGLRRWDVRVMLDVTPPSLSDPAFTDAEAAEAVEALLASLNQGDTPC